MKLLKQRRQNRRSRPMKPSKIHGKLWVAGLAAAMAMPIGIASFRAQADENPNPLETETASESAEVQFARYLTDSGVQVFGAYWCPHSRNQKAKFGKEAFESIDYVECDPRGENSRPQLCQDEEIRGYPTWKINGQLYPGDRSLEELADLSGYPGNRNFTSIQP
ncbi:MAG: protein disulfide isomerase family protein [Geitlerinemataceae cyanobacterium]